MKIVYVAHSLLSRGGDKMVLAHAGWLAAHGHDVELCCNVMDTVLNIPEGVRFSRPCFPGKLGTVVSALLQGRNADIVLASIIPMACFLFPRSRRKVVYFAQDYNENSYSTVIQKLFIRLLYAVSFALFKIPVIAVSDELGQLFNRRFGTKTRVVLNGVDLKIFYHDPSEDLLCQKENRKVILFFSRRDSRKGFDLALATIAKVAGTRFPLLEVWTVGERLDDGEVPCPRRDFGYVCESKLRQIMSSADLFLYPSRSEGFPLMVLEAFACKCPVVTTEAIPYAIDGENALVASIEDVSGLTEKVVQILSDPDLAHELTDKAGTFVLNYSLETSAKKFEAALKALLEK
jgi:glycosyltransferase involved in cell wall biosynthesis